MIFETLAGYATGMRIPDESRASTLGASEVGQCARKMFYLKNEADPQFQIERDADYVDNWGARLRGTIYEKYFWAPALRAEYGKRLKFAGNEQRRFESEFISATPDGLLLDVSADILAPLGVPDVGGDCILLEAKTIDPRAKLEVPKPEHVYQVIVQMGVLRENTAYAPNYAVVSYADASFWHEVREFAVAFDAGIFANAKARAARVLTAAVAHELKPEGWISGGNECRYCPYTRACGIERQALPNAAPAAVDPQFVAEIRDLAHIVKQHQNEAGAAETLARETQHEIKERLRAKRLRRVDGDDFSVIWSPVKGRSSMNIPALKKAATAAGIDVAQFEQAGEPTDRLDIRVQQRTQSPPSKRKRVNG